MNKPIVTADKSGQAIVISANNPEYGYVRVEQIKTVINDRGWISRKPVAALILGKVAILKEEGYHKGQELKGAVIIKEQLTPFNKKDPEKDVKIAGKTGIICRFTGVRDGVTYDNAKIYRKTFYSQNPDAQDDLILNTNKEEIKAAYVLVESESNLNLD